MIKYVTNGAWGTGVGYRLAAAEIDENFYTLKALADDLQDQVDDFSVTFNSSVSGTVWTVTMGADIFTHQIPTVTQTPIPVSEVSVDELILTGTEKNTYLRATHVDGLVVVVPDDDDLSGVNTGDEWHFRQTQTNAVAVIAAATAVVITGKTGYADESAVRGGVIILKKTGPNTYDLFGDLALEAVT